MTSHRRRMHVPLHSGRTPRGWFRLLGPSWRLRRRMSSGSLPRSQLQARLESGPLWDGMYLRCRPLPLPLNDRLVERQYRLFRDSPSSPPFILSFLLGTSRILSRCLWACITYPYQYVDHFVVRSPLVPCLVHAPSSKYLPHPVCFYSSILSHLHDSLVAATRDDILRLLTSRPFSLAWISSLCVQPVLFVTADDSSNL
jgi:hypothetical protein